ncbi:MAG: hypothetical protein SFX73_31380 [Kofleriaceae bacterium]|nr:hypothetical protein [Kofleriaceae bacterium]
MKLSVLAAVAALALGGGSAMGCKQQPAAKPVGPPAAAARYQATRWVPANPSYVFAAPTVREAQSTLRDVIEVFGMPAGIEVAEIGRELAQVLAVDPLSPDAVHAIGVDIDGGFAMFSEDITPTYVLHLDAPEQMQAFLDAQREKGLVTQSVIVDKTEIFTVPLAGGVALSWAIVDGWMWLHLTPPFAKSEGTTWFTHSFRPATPDWIADWAWAEGASKLATPSVVGFLDLQQFLGTIVKHAPEALQCTQLLAPVTRVGFAAEVAGGAAQLRLALDVGPKAASISRAQLPVPEGFAAVAKAAPLAAQWNLDLFALRNWLEPCLSTFGARLTMLDTFGVRAGRAALLALDADATGVDALKKGAGVVALDLAHARFFASQLDNIPMRSTLERSRTFGPLAGHSLSIPFVASVDYVLTDELALAGMGDGLLARVVGSGKPVDGPLASIDLIPGGLPGDTWVTIAEAIGLPRAERIVERMRAWKDGHFRVAVEGNALVLTATGTRR